MLAGTQRGVGVFGEERGEAELRRWTVTGVTFVDGGGSVSASSLSRRICFCDCGERSETSVFSGDAFGD